MRVVRIRHGRVSLEDSVATSHPATGRLLRDGFFSDIPRLTLGLVQVKDSSLRFGPIELLRFGRATVTRASVQWPIVGGLLVGAPGGHYRIEATGGRLSASMEGYRPSLPLPMYLVTQLPAHHLVTRLHLLRVRGREPAPGAAAPSSDRLKSAAIDLAFCAALAVVAARRHRLRTFAGIAMGYHVASWSISGRTLGSLFMRQRVVAVDGSRASAGQAVLRLLALPIALVRNRPDHDQIAGTEVIDG